ncbi:T9SS type A sorting domain-containing protein [bacterium]|nr:T9SS type A sorting domain-containing protein [bacterium]
MKRYLLTALILLLSFSYVFSSNSPNQEVVKQLYRHTPDGPVIDSYYADSKAVPGLILGELDEPELLWSRFYEMTIGQSIAVGYNDHLVHASNLNSPTADFFLSDGDGEPLFSVEIVEARVAAAGDVDRFVLVDFNADEVNPQTTITVFDMNEDDPEIPISQVFLDDERWFGEKPLHFNRAGTHFALGHFDMLTSQISLKVYNVEDLQNPETYITGNEYAPRNLRLSDDGSICAVMFGPELHVWEVGGDARWVYDVGFSNDAMGMSGDGSIVAYGWSEAYAYRWNVQAQEYDRIVTQNEQGYCGELAISGDGSTMASAWYSGNYNQNKLIMYDLASGQETWTYEYPTTNGQFQDLPSAIAISVDGRWTAVGVWGDQDSDREVACFDLFAGPEPYFVSDMPGSVFGLDISPDGDIVAATAKHVHANEFGRGGDIHAIRLDTPGIVGPARWIYLVGDDLTPRVNMFGGQTELLDILDVPMSLTVSADGNDVYYTGEFIGIPTTLHRYDALRNETDFVIDYGSNSLDYSNDEAYLYLADEPGMVIFSMGDQDVIDTYDMNGQSGMVVKVGPDETVMAINESGEIYLAPQGDFEEWVMIGNVDLAGGTATIEFHPTGLVAYICTPSNAEQLTVIPVNGDQYSIFFDPGVSVYGIAPSPDGEKIYVNYHNADEAFLGLGYLVSDTDGFVYEGVLSLASFAGNNPGQEYRGLIDILPDKSFIAAAGGVNDLLYVYDITEDTLSTSLELPGSMSVMEIETRRITPPEFFSTPGLNLVHGVVEVGSQDTIAVEIENRGSSWLWMNGFREEPAEGYIVLEQADMPLGIPGGGSATMNVVFAPPRNGVYTDTLLLELAHGESYEYHLFGSGSGEQGIDDDHTLPKEFSVTGPYPNPFNPETSWRIELPVRQRINLRLFNLQGQLLHEAEADYSAGVHTLKFDGSELATGIYYWKIEVGSMNFSGKTLLLR